MECPTHSRPARILGGGELDVDLVTYAVVSVPNYHFTA